MADELADICVGIASEGPRGFEEEISLGVERAVEELGGRHQRVADASDEASVDLVLAIGNPRIYPDLVRRPPTAPRILWHAETLPIESTTALARSIHRAAPTGRLLDGIGRLAPGFARSATFARWREVAALERETWANLRWLRDSARAFSCIAIDSVDRARGARQAGLRVEVVPLGYHQAFAGPLDGPQVDRDVDVLMLGHLPGIHGRRQHLLPAVEHELARRGVGVMRVTPGTEGHERRALLERTRVVMDVHRVPGNHPGFRFIVASAAGAALVSEPLSDPWPLVPGRHYREASIEGLASEVVAVLADEPARRRLVGAAQGLLATDLHLRHIVPGLAGLVRTEGRSTIFRR